MKTKKIVLCALLISAIGTGAVSYARSLQNDDMAATGMDFTGNTCMAAAPNNGTYTRTNSSVSIYTESGHPKGTFAVYLHNGKRYIDFYNTWICIQGKSRFGYGGNWYVIK